MSLVIDIFIAGLLWGAAAFQSDAALCVAMALLWFLTGLTWVALVGAFFRTRPIKKNPIRLVTALSLLSTCAIAFALTVYFDRIWLPAMMVIGHLLIIGIYAVKFDEQRTAF